MGLKYVGIILLLGIGFGFGLGYKLFNKELAPAAQVVDSSDKSQEKKVGKIIKYLPSKCDGKPQEIASVEEFKSETKNDIEISKKEIPPDNFMAETDFKSEVGIKYKPFDNIPLLNKAWIGTEYNFQHNELKLKAAFTTRLNL